MCNLGGWRGYIYIINIALYPVTLVVQNSTLRISQEVERSLFILRLIDWWIDWMFASEVRVGVVTSNEI